MYEKHKDFDPNGSKAKKCRKVLDFLYMAFPSKTPELERFNLISLYSVSSQLLEKYVVKDRAARTCWLVLELRNVQTRTGQIAQR